ncbi:thioredoxin domain-containing protein [Brumimicrobium glaciale]|uniref:Thioredoxin domain-containing protein n=1 Tax=Brumimicrobium glaciale TaxID=200475 RepID=A0A4Q4KR69_9FLAO|nr:thioredoxin domain-containing protein [Brumimicrobium glaciale]RYM36046.1 thioredoxin domain-containing protein [Brumimicrobium glaciale]
MAKHTNELINSSSPYLLQHAHNPVNWVEWSEAAFDKAKKENKLVLISVGYSACHWCHVMERESFENEEVAELMNKHLICIKVDREERPDVDQIYMNAVQLMTQQGGWPLNCFALPDGRPFFGGTYFKKEQWMDIIHQLWNTFTKDKKRVLEYAEKLTEGVINSELIEAVPTINEFDPIRIKEMVQKWKQNFDFDEGGNNRAPKFPLPNNYEFLLRYGVQKNDLTVINHSHKTLRKMALGGIYDQLGGGFSRYSVDDLWKAPHFEKMLYDNGQLLSLYAKGYQHSNDALYKDVIDQTINWLLREMRDADNGFYSALDADSEGVEGKYYTWTKEELKEILAENYEWFAEFYNVNPKGYWEDGVYILLRTYTKKEWCELKNIEITDFEKQLEKVHHILNKVRNKRIRPGLDDKQLTSWNAMAIKGLVDSGLALQNDTYIQDAKKTSTWILDHQFNEKTGQLYRTRKDGISKINGFLEDYANVIDAFIALYEATFEEIWIDKAAQLTDFTIQHFFDEKSKMFFFTDKDTDLLTRKLEVNDNVIPASNSIMARNLFQLSKFYHLEKYKEMSKQMLSNLYDQMPSYGSGYSNWGMLALSFTESFYEVAITGEDAVEKRFELGNNYVPNALFAGGKKMNIPFLDDKSFTKESTFYVCENFSCQAPTQSLDEVLLRLRT